MSSAGSVCHQVTLPMVHARICPSAQQQQLLRSSGCSRLQPDILNGVHHNRMITWPATFSRISEVRTRTYYLGT